MKIGREIADGGGVMWDRKEVSWLIDVGKAEVMAWRKGSEDEEGEGGVDE